ncbi:hypothetical protein BKA69DRAFT_1090380 [Paraphysoderma sedebokerense]|nr:hypothetical protein BKA69DRAFT_1090380 [Paraphysoderma sedebokerense]
MLSTTWAIGPNDSDLWVYEWCWCTCNPHTFVSSARGFPTAAALLEIIWAKMSAKRKSTIANFILDFDVSCRFERLESFFFWRERTSL